MSNKLLGSEPIAALASGHGPAGVALLRVSGDGCHDLLKPLLKLSSNNWPPQLLRRAEIIDPETHEILDDVLVVRFVAPRSYTGEDVAELHCHGGSYIVTRILRLLYQHGFRPAEPGEFTRRAFLNGKLDLSAAEGIHELISAQSHQQWLAARHLATGRLKQTIDVLRQELLRAMAYLEAQIDFPDEGDTASADRATVRLRVAEVQREISRLIVSYNSGKVAAQGLGVALFGEPNAGKSSLMNALLGRERAIVTEIPGTTRDWLEESCLIEGRLIRLIDTAGIRQAEDRVERLGVEASLRIAHEADIVLFLLPCDSLSAAKDKLQKWLQELTPRSFLVLLTKQDLGVPNWRDPDWIALSCQTGDGMPELREMLAQKVDQHVGSLGEESFISAVRHLEALKKAQASLKAYEKADDEYAFEDMMAFELLNAAKALKDIIGEVGSDDVLDIVFKEFCVGK